MSTRMASKAARYYDWSVGLSSQPIYPGQTGVQQPKMLQTLIIFADSYPYNVRLGRNSRDTPCCDSSHARPVAQSVGRRYLSVIRAKVGRKFVPCINNSNRRAVWVRDRNRSFVRT